MNETFKHEPSGFDSVIHYLKNTRCKASRLGWNGKGQYVFAQAGYPDGININKNTAEATGVPEGTLCKFVPYLMLKNAQGDFCPWTPSQGDLFADDWIVESL